MTRARSPPPSQSRSGSQPPKIYARKKMLAGKGKGIELEYEHDRPSKNQKAIAKMYKIVAEIKNEHTWEDLIKFDVGEGAEGQYESGLKDPEVVVVDEVEEKEKDKDEENKEEENEEEDVGKKHEKSGDTTRMKEVKVVQD
ncbi:hypothetical protein L1987_09020 [Smallanthus sonchifolius]|uniref:Uncharacterized protein n=1 Tax=Smallanthus sonchifolius TaxID=185202 RepID=A0ACB9JM81_9ASTR|nr:hypothetical protein L1987_09020 [Smallanthus sonchifolius]